MEPHHHDLSAKRREGSEPAGLQGAAAASTTSRGDVKSVEEGEALIANTTFVEWPDLDVGAYLHENWEATVLPLIQQVEEHLQNADEKQVPPKRALELFIRAAYERKVDVTYKKGRSDPLGRWHAVKSRSLQCIKRVARHTMCARVYVDVDIVNAHPTLLQHLCRKHGFDCPSLTAYVQDRGRLLAELCDVADCDGDHAKKVYLAVLNGGEKDYNRLSKRTAHLKAFHDEMEVLRVRFKQAHPDLYAQVKAGRENQGKTRNHSAGLLSCLCNRLENKVLVAMWCFFGCPRDCVLCFDGIMLRRPADSSMDDASGGYDLTACAAHVQRELGVAIQLKAKPFDQALGLPRQRVHGSFRRFCRPKPFDPAKLDDLLEACTVDAIMESMTPQQRQEAEENAERKKEVVGKAYALTLGAVMDYVNQYFFTVKGSTVLHCSVEYDAEGRVADITYYKNQRALLENLEDFVVRNKLVYKTDRALGQLWLKSKQRPIYYKQVFAPNKVFDYKTRGFNVRNMWSGWRYEHQQGFEVDADLIARLTTHLRDVICTGNEQLYEYMLKLWKLILMGKKTGVALCITGAQGSGKSLMMEYFGRRMIVGDSHYAFFQTLDDLTGRFSSERCFKCFVVCDELGTWAGDHGTANQLKSLVTQTKTKLERKGIDPRTVDDFANFVFLTNHRNAVKVEGKADRRYCVVEVSNHRLGDAAYFNALALDMGLEPEDGYLTEAQRQHADRVGEHFFHFVMQQDVRGFKPSRIPATSIRQRMEAAATPPLTAFVRWFVEAYVKILAKGRSAPRVRALDLFDGYERLMEHLGCPVKFMSAASLSRRLKRDFQLFADHAHRCASGPYFATSDARALRRVAEDLDTQFTFDADISEDLTFTFQGAEVEDAAFEFGDDFTM